MADILHIGKSGLLAARANLTVTGENIALSGTEGYRRRDLVTEELVQRSGSASSGGASGLGVAVTTVRRAFDALLAERTREAAGQDASAATALPYLERLEERLMPEGGGIAPAIGSFFASLAELSATPSDGGLRQVVLQTGKALAAEVTDLAGSLAGLTKGIADDATQRAAGANRVLGDLAAVNKDLAASRDDAARLPLLDRRDLLLRELGTFTAIEVTPAAREQVTVRLGADGSGPVILDGNGAARLSVSDTLLIEARSPVDDTLVAARRPESGAVHGLSLALGGIDAARTALSDWTARLADTLNGIHAEGVDANGAPGVPVFAHDTATGGLSFLLGSPGALATAGTLRVTTDAGNLGAGRLDPVPGQPAALVAAGRVVTVEDAATGAVSLRDRDGVVLDTATLDPAGAVTLGGLALQLTGMAQSGDSFTVEANTGATGDARQIERMADLRAGPDGFATDYAEILAGAGAQVAATRSLAEAAGVRLASAERAEAGASAVDLDTEAAALLRHQQAYQANARVMTVARQLFDTLLQSM